MVSRTCQPLFFDTTGRKVQFASDLRLTKETPWVVSPSAEGRAREDAFLPERANDRRHFWRSGRLDAELQSNSAANILKKLDQNFLKSVDLSGGHADAVKIRLHVGGAQAQIRLAGRDDQLLLGKLPEQIPPPLFVQLG